MSRAIGSLCSGYGGLDAAAEQLTGGTVAWVSDIDKGACKILAHRYPDVPNIGDFTTQDWALVKPIYMLTAGYPCQPFSQAGKREGTNDARHLWPEVLRCLTELRPPFALFENVRGHLSLGFDQVLADLATHDYDARWTVLRAADIGAPHGRARLFILAADARRGDSRWDLVGARRGAVRVGGVRGEDPDAGGAAGGSDLLGGMTLLRTPGAYDGMSGGSQHPCKVQSGGHAIGLRDQVEWELLGRPCPHCETQLSRALTVTLLPTPAVNDMGASYTPDEWDAWTDRMKAEHGNGNGHGKSLSIEAQRLLPTPSASAPDVCSADFNPSLNQVVTQTPPLPASAGRNRVSYETPPWGDYAPAIHRWEQILGRPAPAPTMTSAKGNPQLSPRFVEWMMGLPDGWVTDVPDMSRNECLKALGNGVVTQQAVEAVRRLLVVGERAA